MDPVASRIPSNMWGSMRYFCICIDLGRVLITLQLCLTHYVSASYLHLASTMNPIGEG